MSLKKTKGEIQKRRHGGMSKEGLGKFQITSRELELAVRDTDKPCQDCGGSV